MPCYNEEQFIARAIESLVDDYSQENCEILVVDGISTDGTGDIVISLIKRGLPIKLFENKKKLQAFGLNLGLSKAKGEFIVRADAHCLYPPGYVKNCVELLELKEKEGVANVGGVMKPLGTHLVQKSIAVALQHPLGVGDAKFHLGTRSGYVDTVFLGAFKKKLFEDIGLYDEEAHPNEDAELNLRILKARKKIYLDSSIKVIYFPRESFWALAKQYFRYGQGRAYTTWKHKKMTSWRQVAPPILVIGVSISTVLGFIKPLFLLFPIAYIVFTLTAALGSRFPRRVGNEISKGSKILFAGDEEKRDFPSISMRFLIFAAFEVMHVCWGIGFLTRMLKLIFKKKFTLLENSSG
jgi:glycosyltransferase involved in cell wall biosynthesis